MSAVGKVAAYVVGRFVGFRCRACNVRPGRLHQPGCPTGAWDGGRW